MDLTPQTQVKKRRRSAWFLPLTLVAVFSIIIVILSLFYRVRTIEVVNGTEYADGQIIEASGIELGSNLFFVDRFSAASMIFSNLPYVDAVTIQQAPPSKIVIQVQGSMAIASVDMDGEHWLLDRKGRVLGKIDEDKAEEFIELRSIELIDPLPGEMAVADEKGTAQLSYALSLLDSLTAEKLISRVGWLDMKDPANPVMDYGGRFTVTLGANEEVPYKIALLRDVMDRLSKDDRGTLHYAGGASWSFSPD